MHPDNHLLVISLNTKLNLCWVRIRLVAFLPLIECIRLRHSSSNCNISCTWPDPWPNTWPNWALSIHTEHPSKLEEVVISWPLISWLISKLRLFTYSSLLPSSKSNYKSCYVFIMLHISYSVFVYHFIL